MYVYMTFAIFCILVIVISLFFRFVSAKIMNPGIHEDFRGCGRRRRRRRRSCRHHCRKCERCRRFQQYYSPYSWGLF